MKEVIKTSKTIIDMEREDVFVEISVVRTDAKLEMELYTFREHPTNGRMLLVKCIGIPEQEQEFLTVIYSAIYNPKEWIERHKEDSLIIDFE